MTCKETRLIVARFDEGEDLLNSLTKCAVENDIRSGWFNLIGGLRELTYSIYEKGRRREFKKTTDNCFEILQSGGNITMQEGKILVHCHVMAAGVEEVFGGHLMEGSKIYPFAEVFIHEVNPVIDRKFDKKLNLWPIDIPIR